MDSTLKQRLIGAAVLAALAIIFLPMLLKGPDVKEPDAAEVPLTMPAAPGQDFETRELPLTLPEAAPSGAVLGMATGATPAPADPDTGVDPTPPESAQAVSPAPSGPAGTGNGLATTPAPVQVPTPAKAPAPAPLSPAEAARVAAGNHVVNIGTFANRANADALAGKLRAARLPVLADRVALDQGTGTRLRVGPYATRAAAEAARLRADQVSMTSSKVVVLDAPAATTPTPAVAPAKPATASAPTTTAPAATAGAPAPAPASAAGAGFAVQLSAPSVEADANKLRDRARTAGFNSFVQRVDTEGGARFRVRVGPVADRSAAVAMRDQVNGKLGTGGIVVTNP
jgi:cell division septation protein DedD